MNITNDMSEFVDLDEDGLKKALLETEIALLKQRDQKQNELAEINRKIFKLREREYLRKTQKKN